MRIGHRRRMLHAMVGAEGFEPPTLCSQSRCATRLRYAPMPARNRLESLLIVTRFPIQSPLPFASRSISRTLSLHGQTTHRQQDSARRMQRFFRPSGANASFPFTLESAAPAAHRAPSSSAFDNRFDATIDNVDGGYSSAAERLTVAQDVVGSIPTSRPNEPQSLPKN